MDDSRAVDDTCHYCEKEITEADDHLIIEFGTANIFCSPKCYQDYKNAKDN